LTAEILILLLTTQFAVQLYSNARSHSQVEYMADPPGRALNSYIYGPSVEPIYCLSRWQMFIRTT